MPQFLLTDEYEKRLAARAVPGAWYKKGAGWLIEDPTPRAAAVALKLFPHLIREAPDLLTIRESLAQDVRPIDMATQWVTAEMTQKLAGNVRQQLWGECKDFYEYQEIDLAYAAAILRAHGGFYLGWDRGLGKTLGTCALIDELDCQRTLVVCPNTAKQSVWAAELARWCPWVDVLVLPNDKTKRDRMMADVANYTRPGADREGLRPFVLVIHYEAINVIAKERSQKNGWKRYGEWDLVVADEAHRIKNPDTQMARQLKRIPSRMRLALSGSIIANHAEELFSQLQWLYPDRYRSKWRDWSDRYLDYVDSGFANVCVGVRVECLAQLRDELGRFMVVRTKEDELDLPELVEEARSVELSSRQRAVYDDLAESYIAQLGDDESPLKASDGLVLLTRLRQVATGLDLVSNELTDSSKQDVAFELIADNEDEAFVVFSWFKTAATTLAQRLEEAGIGTFVVTGDTPASVRADYIERFQAGEGRVFIGTISTLGESVTLHRANNAIFLDRSWNPAQNEQARDRIYRIGQQKHCVVTHIVAADTVDEYNVLPALADKQALRRIMLGTGQRAAA